MSALNASSLKFWESVGLWGFVFVWVGVAGEGAEIFAKLLLPKLYKARQRCFDVIGAFFWIVLVLALAAEFLGNVKAMRISDTENATLGRLASAANERAESTALQVETLRKENIALNAKLNPRVITAAQREEFLSIVSRWPKAVVKVFVGEKNAEADAYAFQIRRLLDDAGYGAPGEVVRRDDFVLIPSYPSRSDVTTMREPYISLIMYTTDPYSVSLIGATSPTVRTNVFPGMTIVSELTTNSVIQHIYPDLSDERALPAMLYAAFRKIQIHVEFMGATAGIKPGELQVLVSPRLY